MYISSIFNRNSDFCTTFMDRNSITFTTEQVERYSRHIMLKEVGGWGQLKLLESKVLIIGAGGLGSPAALYLAAAGVGTIGIADGDLVDLSNLQRQIIHATPDVGKSKIRSARDKIEALNPDVRVITHEERVLAANIREIIGGYDFVIDGTDNFPAKFLINDACVIMKKPYSHAGILGFYGQTLTYTPGTACYRCIFRELPPKGLIPTCREAGVLGVVAGILGTIQTAEALKFILGIGDLLTNRFLYIDVLTMESQRMKVEPDPKCPVCGRRPSIRQLTDYEQPECDAK